MKSIRTRALALVVILLAVGGFAAAYSVNAFGHAAGANMGAKDGSADDDRSANTADGWLGNFYGKQLNADNAWSEYWYGAAADHFHIYAVGDDCFGLPQFEVWDYTYNQVQKVWGPGVAPDAAQILVSINRSGNGNKREVRIVRVTGGCSGFLVDKTDARNI